MESIRYVQLRKITFFYINSKKNVSQIFHVSSKILVHRQLPDLLPQT